MHVAVLATEQGQIDRRPEYVADAEWAGGRSVLIVPMMKQNKIAGRVHRGPPRSNALHRKNRSNWSRTLPVKASKAAAWRAFRGRPRAKVALRSEGDCRLFFATRAASGNAACCITATHASSASSHVTISQITMTSIARGSRSDVCEGALPEFA